MDEKKRVFSLVTFGLLICTVFGLLAPPVLGRPPEKIEVLIAFDHQPGPNEQALVHRAGGTVKHTYHLVPAIAATVPETAVAGLMANPPVLRVEPDLRARAVEVFDTELTNAWGAEHIGSGPVHSGANKGVGVSIAIIDSGVDYTHPDLNANYAGGYDYVQDDAEPLDVYGHGTHVAGTACAEDNDNGTTDPKLGVVGVAPECALYSLRVLDDDGYGSSSAIIAAMQWAVDHGIQVANLSLGWDRDPGATVQAAFDNAWNAGMVVVAAAGNSGNPAGKGNSVIYPAKYASVIAVAATDDKDRRASFSSTGEEVDLAAPGVSVFSTWNDGTSYYDPQPVCGADALGASGCYKYGSGTSMASPHAAGVAALIIAANGGSADNAWVRARLQSTADDLGAAGLDPQFGYGLVDADEAAMPSEPVTDLAIKAVEAPGSVVQGDLVSVNVMVENIGNQDVASDINVTLTDETDKTAVGTQTIAGGLSAGGSATLTFFWDTGSASLGDHTLTASHDFTDDESTNNAQSIVVTVNQEATGVSVTGIAPDSMAAGTTMDVTVSGSGFVGGASLTFESGAGPAPEASGIVVVDGNTLTATVYAKSGGPFKNRAWDVRVTNPDGSIGVLTGGFTVTP